MTETTAVRVKPRLRGIFHLLGFLVSIPLGVLVVVDAEEGTPRVAAIVFAATVVTMFGASALYHCPTWSDEQRRWLRRLDHAGIFGLIAGTYTPFGLLVLDGWWRSVVLGVVWVGSAISVVLRLFWATMPKWLTAVLAVGLGWVAIVAAPLIVARVGVTASLLVVAGGAAYTAGAVIYARRKPDWHPAVFGYHELFHVLVVAAVALQYASVALIVS